MSRIGVFICHCGENIGKTVDCARVAEEAKNFPGVVFARDNTYTCSEPGQAIIREAIKEHKLTAVVIGSCSPRMHESTFRRTCSQAGLNPYMCEIANLREQCSWVHSDRAEATAKAIEIVRSVVARVRNNNPLEPIRVPITKKVMVVGGGIAGIQCALDLAEGGAEVVLVERTSSLGGHMSQLSETFPTLDCSQCILTPRMVDAASNPRIKLEMYTEVEKVDGYIGNFQVTLHRKARYVDWNKCTGCGACTQKCPQKKIPSSFDEGMSKRTAISIPFPQAVPSKPTIDKDYCMKLTTGKCGVCAKICKAGAIDYEQKDEHFTVDVGAIVMATGFQVMDTDKFPYYAGGSHPNLITGLQFERIASASGPTSGEIKRPSDGKPVKTIAFVQCAGSRDKANHVAYCSKICCMYTAKHATLFKHKVHDGNAWVMCMDVRTPGKGYDEFYRRTIEHDGVHYIRSRVSRIIPDGDDLILMVADTLDGGRQLQIKADMVVLATAAVPQPDVQKMAQTMGIAYDGDGWLTEVHPKLRPVETATAGIFLAGACSGPKDIPDTVSQASAVAAKVLGLFAHPELQREPTIAKVNRCAPPLLSSCVGCFTCEAVCPYKAIERETLRARDGSTRQVAKVNAGLCQGCGTCVATCPSKSIELDGYTDKQIFAALNGLV